MGPDHTRFKDYGNFSGGTGLSAGYAAPSQARRAHANPPAATDPFKLELVPFTPGKKTGPIEGHRDGGGPEREIEDAGDVGLPE